MKTILVTLFAALTMVACGGIQGANMESDKDDHSGATTPAGSSEDDHSGATVTTDFAKAAADRVEVLVFYGKQRCVTCRAIEELARGVVEGDFAEQVKSGAVVFRIVDITLPENEALAEKYEVAWSSLYVVGYKAGHEQAKNLTESAFANAKNNPDVLRKSLKQTISELLR